MAIILSDEEYNNARDTKEGLEALLTKVCALAVEDALRVLPNVVQHLVVQVANLKESTDKFYTQNSELVPYKAKVAEIIEELEAKNPGSSMEDILREASKVARARIGQLESIQSNPKNKPTLEDLDHLTGMFEEK